MPRSSTIATTPTPSRNRTETSSVPPRTAPGSIGLTAVAPILWYVSKAKVLGANYGAMVVLPWANAALEAPAFTVGQTVDTSFADLLIRPLDLGWHTKGADVTAGFQFYAPTGTLRARRQRQHRQGHVDLRAVRRHDRLFRREADRQSRHHRLLGTARRQERHQHKVGQLLTLEGGLGKSYLGGGLILGAAYYAQWKLTEDQLADFVLPGGAGHVVNFPGKHKVWAFGPDVTLPVASKSKLFSLVNIRYLWETGARSRRRGRRWPSPRPSLFPA